MNTTAATILVVDDNADNRALAQATLEDEGYTVVLADNGLAGVDAFASQPPDCVLLDVRMPGLDGFAVCERLRALPHGPETPIIFLTAYRDLDTFDRALQAGADDFLTKPVRPVELLVRVEAALKLKRMGSELREQYVIVRAQRDALMRLQLQKEQLSSFVVHDLKNPIGAVDLHAQLLLRDRDLSERARDSVQRIRDEARGLLRMVLNLLDINRSEEGGLSPQLDAVDLAQLASEIVDAHALKAQRSEVTLVHQIDAATVRADRELLRRVLENLVENAIRHAPANTQIVVSACVSDDGCELRVVDAGPGIALEMRERIFDRFVQLDHGARVVERTSRGLGLTFCKLAVEAHGGSIAIEDAPQGSTFRIRLPHGS